MGNDANLKIRIFEQFRDEFESAGFTDWRSIELKHQFPSSHEVAQRGAFLKKIGDVAGSMVYGIYRFAKTNGFAILLAVFTILPDHEKYTEFYGPVIADAKDAIVVEFQRFVGADEHKLPNPNAPEGYIELVLAPSSNNQVNPFPMRIGETFLTPLSGVTFNTFQSLNPPPSGSIV
jgi:hypothetical protein